MSAAAALALWLASDPAPTARSEWLRVLVAARAAGRAVTLFDLRPSGVADDPPLTPTEQRWLDTLAADGVAPRPASPGELRAALLSATSVLVLASRARASTPPLLLVDAGFLARARDDVLLSALRAAGQILVRPRP